MPEVRRLRKRGATIEVVAFGEILFAPGADVPRFLQRFSAKVRDFAAQEAPANKRPRWQHYGKPLKETMRARTQLRRGKSVFHLHSAVGSTAPHAYYVDQGTGVFGGSGPYPAKVLPPWTVGGASLYENTWRPGYPENPDARRVKQVYIKGQEGQHFFDKALDRGFAFMRLSAFQRPGEGVGGVRGILRSEPAGLADFLGNTPGGEGSAFHESLVEWREWRDEAWGAYRDLGQHGGLRRRLDRRNTAKNLRQLAKNAREDRRAGRLKASIKGIEGIRNVDQVRGIILKARGLKTKQERDRQARERAAIAKEAKRQQTSAKRRAAQEAAAIEETRKTIAANRQRQADREANAYWTQIKKAYPNARLRPSPQYHLFRVQWTTESGTTHHEDFHY